MNIKQLQKNLSFELPKVPARFGIRDYLRASQRLTSPRLWPYFDVAVDLRKRRLVGKTGALALTRLETEILERLRRSGRARLDTLLPEGDERAACEIAGVLERKLRLATGMSGYFQVPQADMIELARPNGIRIFR